MTQPKRPATPITPQAEPEQPNCIYRFYDRDGQLLYVGVTADIGGRWKTHSKTKPSWRQVASATIEHFDSRAEALEAEEVAIRAERPAWNITYNVGRPPRQREVSAQRRSVDIEAAAGRGEWLTLTDLGRLYEMPSKALLVAVNNGFWLDGRRLTLRYMLGPSNNHYFMPADVLVVLRDIRQLRELSRCA